VIPFVDIDRHVLII